MIKLQLAFIGVAVFCFIAGMVIERAYYSPAAQKNAGESISASYAYIPAVGGKIIYFNTPITTIATDNNGNFIKACDANGKCYIGNNIP